MLLLDADPQSVAQIGDETGKALDAVAAGRADPLATAERWARSELPLRLPDLEDFRPGQDPAGPLARAVDWRFFQKDGQWYARETNTMPQWAGSCWYYLRYLDPKNDRAICDSAKQRYWLPVDLYVGGTDGTPRRYPL